ncbi:histidine kinase [Draconibacterium sp. IB214405]|uniref:sensor histidine kinase n=1 Tax=Draconibacterium sp. IB214405 TaxID=3097352 RepID=UPI002A0EAE8E|nr:histidine kinase [Draconibacterium sp. IB214405]MDX8341230.1 histidine kinase [Draconibacterium sp. IB214405]
MNENQLPIFFRYRFLWHLLFWVVVFIGYWVTYGGYLEHYREEFFLGLTVLPARIIGTYTLVYGILPFAIEKKKFVTFGLLTVIHAPLFGFLIYISYKIPNLYPDFFDYSKLPFFYVPKIFNKIISNYGIPILAASIIVFKKWYIDELKNKKLAEEKLAAELNFLKSQVHPHFLFNTLNNLYALTLIKSDKTPDIVLKLSGLLDYMIYKSNDDFVPLQEEIKILESYVELERMRYNERLDLQYNIEGEVDHHRIAPLILLPFIENAFKHGASKDRKNPKVEISIKIDEKCLALQVKNSTHGEPEKDEKLKEGIGLKNVQRRLELIYPKSHKLTIDKQDTTFEVNLRVCWKNE